MASARLPRLTARLQGFGTSIFSEMTALALEHQAVNLGQGFPDFDGPASVKEVAIETLRSGSNQYTRSYGLPPLLAAIAAHQRRFRGLDWDPEREITVYHGATEAIYCALTALCDVGDEVVLFEPYYDSYRAGIAAAGAVERVVTLRSPAFDFDVEQLRRAITPKTRVILVNTPNNPAGKVFSAAELDAIAALCVEHDLVAVTDEVYEHLVFEVEHVTLASRPGMRDRTVVISSAGKTFSFTGWKVGWTLAAPPLTAALRCVHQFVTFCSSAPYQLATAHALCLPDDYFASFRADYRRKRDRLCEGLERAGLDVLVPQGTYFALTDVARLGWEDGDAFCRALPAAVGVAAIPAAAFYSHAREGRSLVRWAFCKTDEVLAAGVERLRARLPQMRPPTGRLA